MSLLPCNDVLKTICYCISHILHPKLLSFNFFNFLNFFNFFNSLIIIYYSVCNT